MGRNWEIMFVISSEYLDWFIKGLNVRFLEVRVLLQQNN
jgi:hypothetical protein